MILVPMLLKEIKSAFAHWHTSFNEVISKEWSDQWHWSYDSRDLLNPLSTFPVFCHRWPSASKGSHSTFSPWFCVTNVQLRLSSFFIGKERQRKSATLRKWPNHLSWVRREKARCPEPREPRTIGRSISETLPLTNPNSFHERFFFFFVFFVLAMFDGFSSVGFIA